MAEAFGFRPCDIADMTMAQIEMYLDGPTRAKTGNRSRTSFPSIQAARQFIAAQKRGGG